MSEYFSDDDIANQFFSLTKKTASTTRCRNVGLASLFKKLIKEDVSLKSPEAFDILIRLTKMATRHVDNKEELVNQLEKAQELMASDLTEFQFPTLLTPEEKLFWRK